MKSGCGDGAAAPRGPWVSAWLRLRRDRWSVAALAALATMILLALFGGAIATRLVGHNGDRLFPYATNQSLRPVGPWAHVPATDQIVLNDYGVVQPPPKGTPQALLVLGADGPLGRDELIRVLDGGRTSLEIGLGAVLIALLIAIPVGAVAGYFGGLADAVVSRFTETVMAFPLLLFLVFATAKLSPSLRGISYSWLVPSGVASEALLIGAFTSFYPTRLVRAQLVTLRSAEFVESGHMIGASDWRILRRHLLPHLIPTLLVWSAVAVATNILLEVGLSFIGVGVQPSTPTWGSLLSTAWGTIYQPLSFGPAQKFTTTQTIWQTIVPSTAILITVLALNQVSEGVRHAIEPWSRR
ncbi:MAG TPA: ABC transporter permease [Gaiellaceae bacterium]|nr:ABC transporter permease [Gaiellaceae bacterium]